jgi:hypothetical protein
VSGQHPPVTCSDFKRVIGALGFVARPKKSGTTHEDWIGNKPDGTFAKVTVDCPKAPFSQDLISSMSKQAGITKKLFYEYYFGTRTPQPHPKPSPKPEPQKDKGRK